MTLRTGSRSTGRPRTPGQSVSPTSSGLLCQKQSTLPLHRRVAHLEKPAVDPSSTPEEPGGPHGACLWPFALCTGGVPKRSIQSVASNMLRSERRDMLSQFEQELIYGKGFGFPLENFVL